MRPIDFFDEAADSYPGRTALIDGQQQFTFAELARLSRRVAVLIARLWPGDAPVPIGIWSPNDYRAVAVTLATMRTGNIVMPLHSHGTPDKVAAFINALEPAAIFFHSATSSQAAMVRDMTGAGTEWICLDGDRGHALEPLLDTDDYIDRWGTAYGNPDRPAFVRQTSGTTGEPKTLIGNISSFAVSHAALQRHLGQHPSPVGLVATPFSHAAGLHGFAVLTIGGTLVLRPEFDILDCLQSIQAYGVTHLWLPVSALHLMLGHPAVRNYSYTSLKQILLGASAPSPDRLKEAIGVFGPCIAVHYGQSEGGFLTWLDEHTTAAAAAGDHPERLASSGTSMHVSRVSIMDDHGAHLPRGQVGEIVARGMSVKPFIRGLAQPDDDEMRTAQRFQWHHTGDLGYLDDEGYLYVVGRKKDMVISGGFKVPAAEVERTIMEWSGVEECAVIGVPDARRGEAVKAIVRMRKGHALSVPELIAHCRARVGAVNSPVSIEQWTELPKNPVGKIDKRLIRQKFWAGAPREIN